MGWGLTDQAILLVQYVVFCPSANRLFGETIERDGGHVRTHAIHRSSREIEKLDRVSEVEWANKNNEINISYLFVVGPKRRKEPSQWAIYRTLRSTRADAGQWQTVTRTKSPEREMKTRKERPQGCSVSFTEGRPNIEGTAREISNSISCCREQSRWRGIPPFFFFNRKAKLIVVGGDVGEKEKR